MRQLLSRLPWLVWLVFLVPFVGSAACSFICYRSIGQTMGLYLGGLVIVTLFTPATILSEEKWVGRIIAFGSVPVPICVAWQISVFNNTITFIEFLNCAAVLICYAAAVAATAAALNLIRFPKAIACTTIVIFAFVWLSWPIWLAPWLSGNSGEIWVGRLVAGHPLFAINGALTRPFPNPWAECSIAYELTNIGDDIPYSMPPNVIRCVIGHLAIALSAICLAALLQRPKSAPLSNDQQEFPSSPYR